MMHRRYHRLASPPLGLRTIAALALLVATLLGAATSVAAARQAQTSVFIWTYENGQVVYDACYVLVDSSDVACDENGNGYVFFPQVPVGTYTVRQVADLGPNRYVEDFTIEVTGIGDPSAPYPGMEMFSTEIVSPPGASGGAGAPGTVAGAEPAGTMEPIALLPAIADVPAGLVETGWRTRSLEEVAGNYTDPAETTRLFTQWGWQGNAVASFALPEGQEAQSGQVNGVYVSIHQFAGANEARAALDFSLTEQAAGTVLQEVPVSPLGEHTRALYGPMDYGNEITILVQQGNLFIRVSAAMLDGDPTAEAVTVTQAILQNVPSASTAGPVTSESMIEHFYVGCIPAEACLNAAITLTTVEGEFIASGTCPDTDMIAPWTCGLRNVPRGIPVVITIDGTAPGYMVEQNPLYWDTSKVPSPAPSEWPGGMPSYTFVQTDGGASSSTTGSAITADPGGSAEATLLMTFRGCPEGFDPNVDDFYANCTIPLDAPDNAFLDYHGEGQGGEFIAFLDRQHNGEYVYVANPGTMNIDLMYLAPVVRDDYQVFGADGANGDVYSIDLADGETREVFVFYWYS